MYLRIYSFPQRELLLFRQGYNFISKNVFYVESIPLAILLYSPYVVICAILYLVRTIHMAFVHFVRLQACESVSTAF